MNHKKELLWSLSRSQVAGAPPETDTGAQILTLRVQVPNNHILS